MRKIVQDQLPIVASFIDHEHAAELGAQCIEGPPPRGTFAGPTPGSTWVPNASVFAPVSAAKAVTEKTHSRGHSVAGAYEGGIEGNGVATCR